MHPRQQQRSQNGSAPRPVLWLSPPPRLPHPPRTLIFSASGSLIYSELTGNTQLLAIARLAGETAPVLVIQQNNRITLRRWHSSHQRFEPID